ncbi:MAG: monovalent cation/H+ antiporter subunit D family protein [Desulfobacteraceae bacterium]|nr:MAG: monovalent cation/H+ antiporter subunit D family protein [Desulfobacteraceae bacterium]
MNQQLPMVIVVLPLFGTIAGFCTGWWARKMPFILAIMALGGSFTGAVVVASGVMKTGPLHYHISGWIPPFGIEYRIDHLNALLLVLISFLALATAVYARSSVEKEMPDRVFLFWCLYLLLITGLLGIAVTGDLFNLFVLLEVASLAGYALVAAGDRRAAVAGFRYLVIGTVGACFYLLGVGYLYIATGTLNIKDLAVLLPPLYGSGTVITAFIFILAGLAIKIALFPFHAWQPDAYTHAPSAVSVIISTAAAKTFTYALIRVMFSVFTIDFMRSNAPMTGVVCWTGAASIIIGSVYAIAQDNLKRMLAYSSIANVGYLVLGIGLCGATSLGLKPVVVHLVNHALIKGAMFMAACAVIYRQELRHISGLQGLSRQMPVTALMLVLASLSMIGLPPGGGFVSKWYLILASIESGQWGFVAVIFVSTLLMLVYFWRVIEMIYIRPPLSEPAPVTRWSGEQPLGMMIPCVVLSVLSFAIGLVWMSGALDGLIQGVNLNFGLGGVP